MILHCMFDIKVGA